MVFPFFGEIGNIVDLPPTLIVTDADGNVRPTSQCSSMNGTGYRPGRASEASGRPEDLSDGDVRCERHVQLNEIRTAPTSPSLGDCRGMIWRAAYFSWVTSAYRKLESCACIP